MKALFTIVLFIFSVNAQLTLAPSISINALEGAWEVESINGESLPHRGVMLIQAPYIFYTEFDVASKSFVNSQGGMIDIQANRIIYNTEFNTGDPEQIGTELALTADVKGGEVTFRYALMGENVVIVANRIDNGGGDLAGAWRITDRMRNGEMQAMRLGARKTIKMITGSRFQWAAYNPETKQFSGTGGGRMTLENGVYTEHIEFFSRNADRVGAKLSFNYKVEGDKWTHSGNSSSGDPIKEIWTRQ